MLSRALSLATVTLLIGCLTAGVARAAENLDAGKSPSQIFSNTCSACHKSPRGLLKNVSASSLPGFLRQHYTTGTDMASVLSSYLISNGAADPRYQSKDQPEAEGRQAGRKVGSARPARSPAAAGRTCAGGFPAERRRSTRKARARVRAATRSGSHGRRRRLMPPSPQMGRRRCKLRPTANRTSGRSRADVASPRSKSRRKPSRQPPAMPRQEDALRDAAKAETAATDSSQARSCQDRSCQDRSCQDRRDQDRRDQGRRSTSRTARRAKSVGESGKSETAKVDAPKENVGSEPTPLRPDPVPPVTPAPPASAATAPEPAPGSSAAAPPPVTATAPAAGGSARRPARAADLAIGFSDFRTSVDGGIVA